MMLVLALLLVLPASAAAHTHAQCLASQPCRDAVEAAVRTAVLERDALILDLQDDVAAALAKLPAVQPCTLTIGLGSLIPWATLPAKATVCLADGDHPFGLEPPVGLSGITIRAATWGQASVLWINLANNNIAVDGVAVVHPDGSRAVWSRVP